ncbi:MAG: hypothetical protein AAGI52_16295 [Bacteroidota bacterium]
MRLLLVLLTGLLALPTLAQPSGLAGQLLTPNGTILAEGKDARGDQLAAALAAHFDG